MRLIRLTDAGWHTPRTPPDPAHATRADAERWWHAREAGARWHARATCGDGADDPSRHAQHWAEWAALVERGLIGG